MSKKKLNENEVLEIIEEAVRDGRTTLNLSSKGLTSLPTEIWELKNLAELDLSNNQLTSLPAEIGELKSLTKLRLDNNQLTKIPDEIGELKKLTRRRAGW